MTGFNSQGALDAVIAIVGSLPGMQIVYRGEPLSLGRDVCAYVGHGGGTAADYATQVNRRMRRVLVVLAYRATVDSGPQENVLSTQLDALDTAFLDPTHRVLGGVAESVRVDHSLVGSPQYAMVAGSEFRLYPILVEYTQRQGY